MGGQGSGPAGRPAGPIIGHTATDGGIIQAMDAARAFLEAQLRQQHKMAEDLEQKQTRHKSRGHGMSL